MEEKSKIFDGPLGRHSFKKKKNHIWLDKMKHWKAVCQTCLFKNLFPTSKRWCFYIAKFFLSLLPSTFIILFIFPPDWFSFLQFICISFYFILLTFSISSQKKKKNYKLFYAPDWRNLFSSKTFSLSPTKKNVNVIIKTRGKLNCHNWLTRRELLAKNERAKKNHVKSVIQNANVYTPENWRTLGRGGN